MAGIGTVLGVVGTLVSAAGTLAAGSAQKAAADFEAAQLDMKAKEEKAASQREALEQRRETNLLQSRGQAVAGASGFSALDVTTQELAGDIEQAGAYREGMIRYGGEERARGLRGQAAATRMSGRAAKKGAMFSAFGTLAGGLAQSFSAKYGGSGPPAADKPFDLLKPVTPSGFFWPTVS